MGTRRVGAGADPGRSTPRAQGSGHPEGRALAARIGAIERLAQDLDGATRPAELVERLVRGLRSGFGSGAAMVGFLGDGGASFEMLAGSGLSERSLALVARRPASDGRGPAATALRAGRPLVWSSIGARDRAYPDLASYPSSMPAGAMLPLVSGGRLAGLLALGWPAERAFDPIELALLDVVRHRCAAAIDRVRARRAWRAEREALEFLHAATRTTASSREPMEVVHRLVQLSVPRLAQWCALYVVAGATLERVALEIAGAGALAATLRTLPGVPAGAEVPVASAFRRGEALVVRAGPPAPGAARGAPPTGPGDWAQWSGLVVPVRAGSTVVGVMSLFSAGWGTLPPEPVRLAADGLAAQVGVALASARRIETERRTAAQLVEIVLPRELPPIPGYEVSARYVPAGGRVAGDWYEVLRLPDGAYLVGIGDAGGHGVEAAALMTELRNAARGLAVAGDGPASIVRGLSRLTALDAPDGFATALYGVLDTATHTLRWAAAGHLPPLVFGAGGARYLEERRSVPLGIAAGQPPEHALSFARGAGIVLVTDGVVERRDAHIDHGMARLRSLVESATDAGAATLAARIVHELCREPHDDCGVVVVRRAG